MFPVDLAQRIERLTKKTEGCWLWQGSTNTNGYGVISVKNRKRLVHRLVWEMAHKQTIPDRMSICHRCDNPLCVRPDHLFLGTHSDNMRDASRKGRLRIPPGDPSNLKSLGIENPSAKLTEEQVREVREMYASGNYSQRRLASRFSVSKGTIWRIVSKTGWSHIK